MKHQSTLLIIALLLCGTLTMKATDYVLLTPLDTAALPIIPEKDYGGNIVRQHWIRMPFGVAHRSIWRAIISRMKVCTKQC